jgi:hypothetical protein
MNRNKSLFLFVILILIFGAISPIAYAISNDKPLPYEKIYPEIGYKTVEEAVKDFKQNLELPLRVPPITFTHNFGRFSDLDGEINDSLEVKLISDISPGNHYKINVRPVKYKIPISVDKRVSDKVTPETLVEIANSIDY